jgi:hypothetical protein
MISTIDIAWAAGFIEGEGSFTHSVVGRTIRKSGRKDAGTPQARITVPQVQREPLERLQRMFGGNIYVKNPGGVQKPEWQPVHYWAVYGRRAAGLAMTLWTFLSPKRRAQAEEMIAVWKATKVSPAVINAAKTHCVHGHEFTEKNTIRRGKNGRRCWTCSHNHQISLRTRKRKLLCNQ